MSAQGPIVDTDLNKLAPKFHLAITQCLEMCREVGVDAIVHEAYRSNELQALYYRRGRPPTPEYPEPVTSARTNEYSWHGYGLAVDIISEKDHWFGPNRDMLRTLTGRDRLDYLTFRKREGERWFSRMAQICKRCDCDSGLEWRDPHKDPPHVQFGTLKASPSDRARELLRTGGVLAVWKAVSAI